MMKKYMFRHCLFVHDKLKFVMNIKKSKRSHFEIIMLEQAISHPQHIESFASVIYLFSPTTLISFTGSPYQTGQISLDR